MCCGVQAAAPNGRGGGVETAPARAGGRPAGNPMAAGSWAGAIALAIMGLIAFLNDERGIPPTPADAVDPCEPGTKLSGVRFRRTGRPSRRRAYTAGVARHPGHRADSRAPGPGVGACTSRRKPLPGRGTGRARHPHLRPRRRPIADHPERRRSHSRALAFSTDGQSLAASTARDGEILLWDFSTGRVRTRLRGPFSAQDLAFSPEAGRSPPEKGSKRVTLWDLETGQARSIIGKPPERPHRSPSRPMEASWPPPSRPNGSSGSGSCRRVVYGSGSRGIARVQCVRFPRMAAFWSRRGLMGWFASGRSRPGSRSPAWMAIGPFPRAAALFLSVDGRMSPPPDSKRRPGMGSGRHRRSSILRWPGKIVLTSVGEPRAVGVAVMPARGGRRLVSPGNRRSVNPRGRG